MLPNRWILLSLVIHWMDNHEMWYTFQWRPKDETSQLYWSPDFLYSVTWKSNCSLIQWYAVTFPRRANTNDCTDIKGSQAMDPNAVVILLTFPLESRADQRLTVQYFL